MTTKAHLEAKEPAVPGSTDRSDFEGSASGNYSTGTEYANRRQRFPALTAARARELLVYDPLTGALNWRVARPGTRSGALAGTRTGDGYGQIEIDYRVYRAHRVIWLIMTGRWPKQLLDHRNGMRADNRWKNLREATPLQNARNRRPGKANTSGRIGISVTAGKWTAYIGVDNRTLHLGVFATRDAAVAAREAAERHHYGEFAAENGGG